MRTNDMRVNLPYLIDDRGMLYVRRFGKRVRLRERPGTPEFANEYGEALQRLSADRRSNPEVDSAERVAPTP